MACILTFVLAQQSVSVTASAGDEIDLRVALGRGDRPYGSIRVSAVTMSNITAPLLSVNGRRTPFRYSKPFRYKWKTNALHTTVLNSGWNSIEVAGRDVPLKPFPEANDGIAAVIIAGNQPNSPRSGPGANLIFPRGGH